MNHQTTSSRHPAHRARAAGLACGLLAILTACGGSDAATDQGSLAPSAQSAEVNGLMYDCLFDQGFPVTRSDDGSIQFTDPDDSRFADYEAAQSDCRQQLADQGLIAVQSADSLRKEFELAQSLHACLLAAGFPLLDLPSSDVYIEQHDSIDILDSTAPVDADEARAACPDEFIALDNNV